MNVVISIIICTYNRDLYIYQTLEKIAQNDFTKELYEILLINNNCTDQTESECKRFKINHPDVNFHYFIEETQGLSNARNRGIKESHGDVIVFLDDDSFVEKSYLKELTNYLKTYPDFTAFGGKIIPLFENGKNPSWLGKWSYIWVSALNKGNHVKLFDKRSYPIGANMGFRKTALPPDGFNTALGRSKGNMIGGEEKEIFQQIRKNGGKIYYFPKIKVNHVIPEKRTTREYIRRLATGVGQTERIRACNRSRTAYAKSLLMEGIKWAVSLFLCTGYLLRGQASKGYMLLYFRYFVTQGLIK